MNYSDQFRNCLIDLDIEGALRIWAKVYPNMPQPQKNEALSVMHVARTASEAIPENKRFYSHRWCCDNGFPSQLPDELRPKAERVYPKVVTAVLISANPWRCPIAREAIGGVMREAVLETYADGYEDKPHVVKARMMEKREIERRALGLNWSKAAR